ncbi:MAG: segregation/condensation protein A [Blautia sp.]|nr:segregation/condensation protein A [Blautia sp.]
MAISIKLSDFEGPLDLLLTLIEKNKVDIFDIPIVQITDQYMEVLHAMEQEDLGLMSEFLVMAATLLDIKCRMLLPAPAQEEGEEEDPRAELVRKLLEYKMYKYMSYELRERMEEADEIFYKPPSIPKEVLNYREPVDPALLLEGVTLEKLNAVFRSIMKKREDRVDPIRSRFGKIEKEPVSVADRLMQIRDYAKTHDMFSFRQLLKGEKTRTGVVVSFLSILELMKMGYIHVEQDGQFGEIRIRVEQDPEKWRDLTDYIQE